MSTEDISPPEAHTNRRRRSSLLKRKSTGFPSFLISEEVARKQYVREANHERDEWQQLFVSRRQRSRELEKDLALKEKDVPTLDYKSIEDSLNQEDKDFIAHFPDLAQVSNDFNNFFKSCGVLQAKIGELNLSRNSVFLRAPLYAISSNISIRNEEAPVCLPHAK